MNSGETSPLIGMASRLLSLTSPAPAGVNTIRVSRAREGSAQVRMRSWKAAVLGLALALLAGAALLASHSLDAGASASAPAGPAEVPRGQHLVTTPR